MSREVTGSFKQNIWGLSFLLKLTLEETKTNKNWNLYNDSKLFSSTKLDLLVWFKVRVSWSTSKDRKSSALSYYYYPYWNTWLFFCISDGNQLPINNILKSYKSASFGCSLLRVPNAVQKGGKWKTSIINWLVKRATVAYINFPLAPISVSVRKRLCVFYSKKLYPFYLLCSFLTITNHGMKKTPKLTEGTAHVCSA